MSQEEPVVERVAEAAAAHGIEPNYEGFTGGTDARHYLDAGIPTVVFGPGSVDLAHTPDEHVEWDDVRLASEIIADATASTLDSY